MNKHLELLFSLSFFTLACKSTFPSILNYEFVQFPALVVFSILAPVGFAISLWSYFSVTSKTTWQWIKPSGYIILFCVGIASSQVSFYGSHTTYYNLAVLDRTYPSTLFNDLVAAETEDQRAIVAKYIYSEFGAAMPYAQQNGVYTTYVPDQETLDLYKDSVEIQSQAKVLRKHLKSTAYQSMYISIYLICAFLIMFCGSMFYLQSKANKALK